MTAEKLDIHEPFRQYVFTFLLFDCHECQKIFSGDPPYTVDASWEWFDLVAEQARNAGWYVSPQQVCLCPDCAKIKGERQ